jgi:magnesium transporter
MNRTRPEGDKRGAMRPRRRSRPGAPPGTLVADPDARGPEINVMLYGPDALDEVRGCPPSDLAALKGRAEVLWIDVTGLGDIAVIAQIGRAFGLHSLSLEDVVDVHQRPKTEHFDDHVFVLARMLAADGRAQTEQLSMFLGQNYVLTFQERPGDCFEPIRERIRQAKGRIRQMGADYLAYAVIDAVIDRYFPVIESLGEVIEHLEEEVIASPSPGQIDRLHQVKRDLLNLRRAIWPTREMVNALTRDDSRFVGATTRVFLRDCYDHAIQLMDIVETDREITSSLLDVYLSSMSARLNEIMKVLTIIATIFIPLGFVAGLYGMNFDRTASAWNMPELGWRFGYPASLAVMVAIAAGLLFYFRRKGWVGKGR